MRSWLSLFFLAPALLAQMQETPFAPQNVPSLQRQTVLIQGQTSQQPQLLPRTQPKPQGQSLFWQYLAPSPQAPNGDPNYWNLQTPPAPEHVQVQPLPQSSAPAFRPPGWLSRNRKFFFAGNPTPKPLVIPRKTMRVDGKPKICSIPLINGLKPNSPVLDKMAVPVPPGDYSRDVVPPPAPPCDDGKR